MRTTEEMLSTLYNLKPRIRRVLKQLNLLFRVCDRVYCISSALHSRQLVSLLPHL
jgi:hypothetical protein